MKEKKVADIASGEKLILVKKVAAQSEKKPNLNTIMRKSFARSLATLPIISLLLLNFTQKADAQIYSEATTVTFQVCNTIMNMHDADPENVELTIGRRECNARAYNAQLCTASGGAFADCWNYYYPVAVDLELDELVAIIQNNQ